MCRSQIDTKLMALETRLKGLSLQWLNDRIWIFNQSWNKPEIHAKILSLGKDRFLKNFEKLKLLIPETKSRDSWIHRKLITCIFTFNHILFLFSRDHEVFCLIFKTVCKELGTLFVSHMVTKRPKWAYDTILKSLKSLISWIESVWKLNLI